MNAYCVQGRYALNLYFDKVCAVMCGDPNNSNGDKSAETPSHSQRGAIIIGILCGYMAPWHIKEVKEIFNCQQEDEGREHKEEVCCC